MIENVQKIAQRPVAIKQALQNQIRIARGQRAHRSGEAEEIYRHLWRSIRTLLQRLNFARRKAQRRMNAQPHRFLRRRQKRSDRLPRFAQTLQQANGLEKTEIDRAFTQPLRQRRFAA